MGRVWASARANQRVRINVTLTTDMTFSVSEAAEINDRIVEIAFDRSKASNDFEAEGLDYGISDDGGTIKAGEEIEFIVIMNVTVSGKYHYTPATMHDWRGDPGSPAEEDFEPSEGYIESIDAAAVLSDLKKIEKIGDVIDESEFSATVDREFELGNMLDETYDPYDGDDY